MKLALENVYAILGHKHWKILQALIEIVLARHLAILKLDLSMFMPMRRLRAFIFVGDVPETHVIVPQRTWFQQHIIQSGMWTPLCRACSEDLIVSESAMNAAVQAALCENPTTRHYKYLHKVRSALLASASNKNPKQEKPRQT